MFLRAFSAPRRLACRLFPFTTFTPGAGVTMYVRGSRGAAIAATGEIVVAGTFSTENGYAGSNMVETQLAEVHVRVCCRFARRVKEVEARAPFLAPLLEAAESRNPCSTSADDSFLAGMRSWQLDLCGRPESTRPERSARHVMHLPAGPHLLRHRLGPLRRRGSRRQPRGRSGGAIPAQASRTNQCAIAASFRSLARWAGRCRVQSSAPRRRQTWPG